MIILHSQVVWKRAHVIGCAKTRINGEPYYIAQMDTPGVIANVPGFDKSNVGQPKEVKCFEFGERKWNHGNTYKRYNWREVH